jgi:membrane-associated phospholipid phosphatase
VPPYVIFLAVYLIIPVVLLLLSLSIRSGLLVVHVMTSYYFAVLFTHFVALLLAHVVGRPRPDAFTLCGGNTYDHCLAVLPERDATNEFLSFPCLEASLATASGTFLMLFLDAISKGNSRFNALFQLIPICWSLFVGAFKVLDRANRLDDVVGGFFIGYVFGVVSFKAKFAKTGARRAHVSESENLVPLSMSAKLTFG